MSKESSLPSTLHSWGVSVFALNLLQKSRRWEFRKKRKKELMGVVSKSTLRKALIVIIVGWWYLQIFKPNLTTVEVFLRESFE
jgi:hypothetical protein